MHSNADFQRKMVPLDHLLGGLDLAAGKPLHPFSLHCMVLYGLYGMTEMPASKLRCQIHYQLTGRQTGRLWQKN